MGLKVSGFGATRTALTDALAPIEQELELIAKTPLEPSALPEGKKALRARADVLDKQIEVLGQHLESADPKVRDSAATLLEVAKRERLRLEDGLLTWVVDDLSRSKKPSSAAPTLTAPEVSAVTALLGGLVTDAELHHAIEVLAPLAGQNLTDAHFAPKVADTSEAFAAKRKKTSPDAMKVAGLRVGPAVGGFLATSAMRSFGSPALAFFSAALAIRMGFTSGKYLANDQIQRVKFETGLNRLEDGSVDHDLGRMSDRARTGRPFEGKSGEALVQAARVESALAGFLASRRKETWTGRAVSAAEKSAVQALETYGTALGAAKDGAAVQSARAAFTQATKGLALETLPSLPELVPHGTDAGRVGAAFSEMMSQYGRVLLGVSNPPLLAFSQQLEAKPGKITADELAYLKLLVGSEPSVGEVLGLQKLVASGRLDAKSLWPADAAVELPNGGKLDQATVGQLLAGLGSRDEGTRLQWWSKLVHAVAPVVGSLVGAGIMAFVPAAGLLLYGGAFAGTLLSEKAGHAAGDYLAKRGATERVMTGVDVAPAVGPEYGLGVGLLARGDALTRGTAAEVSAKLTQEAGTLDALLGAVNRTQAAIQARRAAVGPGPEAELLDRELAFHTELRAPIYAALADTSASLRAAASGGDLSAMRGAAASARAGLLELMPSMVLDVLVSQSAPELSMAHGVYFRAKRELAEAIQAGASNAVVAEIAGKLSGAYASIPKKQRPDTDGLDKWVKQAREEPAVLSDRSAVSGLVTPKYMASLESARVAALSIKDERAKEIGQEVMNAVWSQVFARFGLTGGEDVPQLTAFRIERQPLPDAEGFADIKLTGRIKGGGRFDMKIDALGQPSQDLSTLHLDLGEKILGGFVREAAAAQVAATTGAQPTIGKVKLLDQGADAYRFSIEIDGKARTATVSPDGLLTHDFLSA